MNPPHPARPGLAKTRGEALVRAQVVTWIRGSDARFRDMFERADIVSEGSVRADGEQHEGGAQSIWFGTTSLVLPWPGSLSTPPARAFVSAVAERDPHVRLRAMRTAHREASLRAPGVLLRAECLIQIRATDDGLRIDVDVQAPLTLPAQTTAGGRGPRG